ncbi:MDM1 (YML104C) [Zygosaccharomyces parabailii]|nr:MDM1 (YML104C) [Zygosaccharomyces parabailii]CDH08521.1 related to Structural protein MDM1 [Zygosaccharomyces bailii ISA1307]
MSQDSNAFRWAYILPPFLLAYAWLNNGILGKIIWGLMPIFGLFWYCVIFTTLPTADPPKPKFLKYSDNSDVQSELSVVRNSLFPLCPEISNEIENIINLIIQDFVMSWFSHFNTDSSSVFPQRVKQLLMESVKRLQKLLVNKDEADLVVLRLLPLLNKHFTTFCAAKEAVLSDMTFAKEGERNIDLSIAVEFDKNYKLHKALSLRSNCLRQDIARYVKLRVEHVLPFMIDTQELASPYVRVLLREIISSCIVEPLIVKFSDSDTWNLRFISISDKILEEHDQVDEIRKFLSKEVEEQEYPHDSHASKLEIQAVKLELVPELSNKQFEDFLRQISSFTSFSDLQSAKYAVLTKLLQLKKEENLSKNLLEYRKRLLLSLNLIRTRLVYVTDRSHTKKARNAGPKIGCCFSEDKEVKDFEDFLETITLQDVLQDPFCFSFFEQYLSHNSKTSGLTYLKYWKLVEALKNPLDDAVAEDVSVTLSDAEISHIKDIALSFLQKEHHLADMSSLDQNLVRNIVLLKDIDLYGDNLSVNTARRSMLLLQGQSREILDKIYFFEFKKSNYFLEMISSQSFVSTDIYAKLIDLPSAEKADRQLRTKKSVNAVRILTHSDVDNTLDRILNETNKSGRRRPRRRSITTSETLFGKNDEPDEDKIFNDTLFGNDDKAEVYFLPKNYEETYEPSECLLSSISSRLQDSIDSSSQQLHNSSHGFASLKDDIAKLTLAIDEIEKELELLDHLILKADLTNSKNQLKLLRKSQKALLKDLDMRELLRQQYLVQENANILYGKTKISIKTYFVETRLEDGREIAYYLLSVEHVHQGQVTTWEIPRRFSEFFRLNIDLKRRYKNQMKHLQRKDIFPEKIKMSLKYHISKSLLYEERRTKLERYLRELLAIQVICQDNIFRLFLTDSKNFNPNEGITQEQSSRSKDVYNADFCHRSESTTDFQVRQFDANYEDEVRFYEDDRNFYHNSENSLHLGNKSFVKPICDVFISIFSLDKSNSGWLRGKTIITVLQQLLGSTIEKYVKNSIRGLRTEDQILKIIRFTRDLLWGPSGSLTKKDHANIVHERTKGEKARTQADAKVLLQSLFAETFGKVVGLRSSHEAALKVHGMAQNQYLMASLLLEILDVIINDIFTGEKAVDEIF